MFFYFSVFGQEHPELNSIQDVEIFLFEEFYMNKNSIFHFNEKNRKEIINQYGELKDVPIVFSPDYINSDICKLKETPFLNKYDIESFNWNTGELILTSEGRGKLSQINFKYFGEPFTIKVKGQNILNAWFWGIGSSQICTRVYGQIREGSNKILLKFDTNRYGIGPNPFFNQEKIETLLKLQQ